MDKMEVKNSSVKNRQYSYNLIHISENGDIKLANCPQNQMFEQEQYEKLKVTYQFYENQKDYSSSNYLLVSNLKDINIISETPLFTIQEIKKIGDILKLSAREVELEQDVIIEMINQFVSENPRFKDDKRLLDTITEIKSYKSIFSKAELNDIFTDNKLNNGTKIKKGFCYFYDENSVKYLGFKDILHPFFKGRDEVLEYFPSASDIYYQKTSENEALYFVGITYEQLQRTITNAINIRKIKAVRNLKGGQSSLIFDQLLETMAVDFVKNGALTVIPFPFKYLREAFENLIIE